jgi:AcrR family transcriptional regulator
MTATSVSRSDAQANRARLVHAAHELFRERGLSVDVKEIGERAGVGIGTIYRNFASKDELIAAVVQEIAHEVESQLSALRGLPAPGERVARMIDLALDFADREGVLLQALAEADDAPPAHVVELVQQVFSEAQAAGAIRQDVPPAVLLAYTRAHFALFLELRHSLPPGQARTLVSSLLASAIHLRQNGPGEATQAAPPQLDPSPGPSATRE